MQEAENLLFLEKNSQVKAPKVHAVFTDEEEDPLNLRRADQPHLKPKYFYLVMEYIPGSALNSEIWDSYTPAMQKIICAKISEQLRRLRQVNCEQFYYGRVHKQPFHSQFLMLSYPGQETCGPYTSYEALLDAMFNTAELRAALKSLGEMDPDAKLTLANFKQSLRAYGVDQKPTLTHLDMKFDNIIVQAITTDGKEDMEDYEVTIIDWEFFGWLPPWVQATAMSNFSNYCIPRGKDHRMLMLEIFQGIQPVNLALTDFLKKCGETLCYTYI